MTKIETGLYSTLPIRILSKIGSIIGVCLILAFLPPITAGKVYEMDSKMEFIGRQGHTLRAVHSPIPPAPYNRLSSSQDILAAKIYEAEEKTRSEVQKKIKKVSRQSSVSEKVLWNVCRCESDFDQSARGRAGEIGIFQYLPSTWEYFKKRSGKYHLNINSAFDQIEMTVWAYEKGLSHHWTCFRKIYY